MWNCWRRRAAPTCAWSGCPKTLTLAFLIAIALQDENPPRQQRLLEQSGIPEILALEQRLIAHESKLMQFMLATQQEVLSMNRADGVRVPPIDASPHAA